MIILNREDTGDHLVRLRMKQRNWGPEKFGDQIVRKSGEQEFLLTGHRQGAEGQAENLCKPGAGPHREPPKEEGEGFPDQALLGFSRGTL